VLVDEDGPVDGLPVLVQGLWVDDRVWAHEDVVGPEAGGWDVLGDPLRAGVSGVWPILTHDKEHLAWVFSLQPLGPILGG